MRCFSAGLLALALAAPAAHAADPAPVIAAERAFAARASVVGIAPSFLEFMTDDAIVLAPEPTNARALYASRPAPRTPAQGGPRLEWWPNWAGLSASGDLGFTTGPASLNGKRTGYYFTIWKRQPGGGWKWVYDGGSQSDPRPAPGPAAPVLKMADPAPGAIPQAEAMSQVRAAEAALAATALKDATAAFEAVLAPDTRMQGSPAAPATAPREVAEELARRSGAIAFKPLGGEASEAGDLAWTYGEARWIGGHGHYVRIWRRDAAGWRLAFDQILEVPPPQSA